MKENNKVPFFSSVKTKIVTLTTSAILLTVAIIILTVVPKTKSVIKGLTHDYMLDMARLTGSSIDRDINNIGYDKAMHPDNLNAILKNVSVEGMESSYAYILSTSGSVFYHPDSQKLGKKVGIKEIQQIVDQVKSGVRPEPGVVTYTDNGKKKYASYYVSENLDFILVVNADENDVFECVNSLVQRTINGGIIAIVISGIIGYIVALFIVKPIKITTHQVSKLADLDFTSDGSEKVFEKRKDEMGFMMKSIGALRSELTQVIDNISQGAANLSQCASTMNDSVTKSTKAVSKVEKAVTDIAEGAISQANETQTATENIIVMGSMIEQTNAEVESLSDNAHNIEKASEAAGDIISELKTTNARTMEAINIISNQTDITNSSALRIKEATDIIAEIASETNLLSLNASIEAARAGEQGRGFAVVASQIQKLADQSSSSASQIADIIAELITESKKSVETMKEVREVIDVQSKNVKHTEEAFGEVNVGIKDSLSRVLNITDMTRQLDDARIKIVDVVQSLTAIAEENAASAEETSVSATEVGTVINVVSNDAKKLNDISVELADNTAKFKL